MTEEKRKKPKSKNNDVYLNVLKKIDIDVDSKIREIEMQDESQDQQGGTLRPGLLQSSWRNSKEDDNDNFLSLGDLLNEAKRFLNKIAVITGSTEGFTRKQNL